MDSGSKDSNVYMYDISTSKETQISTSGKANNPVVYGDRIVWTEFDSLKRLNIYIYNISTSEVIPINTSRLGKNGTGEIYVYTFLTPDASKTLEKNLSLDLDSVVPFENANFTILGPEGEYVGNTSYWAKSDSPKGTYTIRYEPVSGYDTPSSETKILKEGDSIKFSSNYFPKKRTGDELDFGDGYILIIKQIDPGNKEVLLELQLDKRKVDEAIVKEQGTVYINKTSYSVNKSTEPSFSKIIFENISQDTGGNYIDLSFVSDISGDFGGGQQYTGYYTGYDHGLSLGRPAVVVHGDGWGGYGGWGTVGVQPIALLTIRSVPEGANITIDKHDYKGQTSRTILIDPKQHSIKLEQWIQKLG